MVSTVSESAATRISTGSDSRVWATRRIPAGMVAEKSATWRPGGVCSKIQSMSSAKPMLSISSASSRTSVLSMSSASVPRLR
jgi:hypothetical protein